MVFIKKENEHFFTQEEIDNFKQMYEKMDGTVKRKKHLELLQAENVYKYMVVDYSSASGRKVDDGFVMTYLTTLYEKLPTKIKNYINK